MSVVEAYLSSAERDAATLPELHGVPPRAVQHVAVLGAGTMGSGIALACLEAGCAVTLLEQDAAALERGAKRIGEHFARRVASGKADAQRAADCQARLHATTDWESLSGADLVIEAVFEDLRVKRDVFARIDRIARSDALLATNTSYLDVDAIAAATSRPQAVVGMHFFSPANVMRLLEIVRGRATSGEALATGLELAKRLRKQPIVTGNAFGFVGNRIFSAYRRQCEFMLDEGALPEEVDAALEAFGFAMGPFAVADLSGLDIAWRMRQGQAATRDPRHRYVRIPDLLCEAGRLGRKTGAGYYRYDEAGSKNRGTPDPQVRRLIEAESERKGTPRRALDAGEIQRRALLAMVNEASLLLGEGVARRPGDVDVALVNGYGFPRHRGGPVFWARERGAEALASDLRWLAQVSGPGFVPGDPRHVLLAPASKAS